MLGLLLGGLALVCGPHPRLAPRAPPFRTPVPLCLAETLEEPPFRIIKGRKIPLDSITPVGRNFRGACIDEPVDPKVALVMFGVTALVAYFGFQTQTNLSEGPDVGRRRALTWLGLQSIAAFSIGPQLTNPCSNINIKYNEY